MTISENIAQKQTDLSNLQQQVESIDKQMVLLQQRRTTLVEQYCRTEGAIGALTEILNAPPESPPAQEGS